jgi:HPt (histidine-containing phosphotransfer) domain-containing protein
VTPTYDLTYLIEVSKGNDAFMLEMINIFLSKTPETLQVIEDAINTSNWEQVGFYAHKLKATYAYMGMLGLKEEIIKIEKSAKNLEGLEEIPQLFNHLKQETTPAMLDIAEYKKTIE